MHVRSYLCYCQRWSFSISSARRTAVNHYNTQKLAQYERELAAKTASECQIFICKMSVSSRGSSQPANMPYIYISILGIIINGGSTEMFLWFVCWCFVELKKNDAKSAVLKCLPDEEYFSHMYSMPIRYTMACSILFFAFFFCTTQANAHTFTLQATVRNLICFRITKLSFELMAF